MRTKAFPRLAAAVAALALALPSAIHALELKWTLSGLRDENGNRPENGQFVGYFVPVADTTGTLRTFGHGGDYSSAQQEFVSDLSSGHFLEGMCDYLYGESFSVGNVGGTISGNVYGYDFPSAGGTIAGFAVVFNSSSVETATQFFVTDVLGKSIMGSPTFAFGNQSGARWLPIRVGPNEVDPADLSWEENGDGTITITGIDESAAYGDIAIPASIDDMTVTAIGPYAFYGCSGLTSVAIPDSVTSVGHAAFWDCSALVSAIIPDGVTNLGEYTLYGCSSLESINIPDSVTNIADNAFHYCESLASIVLPSNLHSIGLCAFSGCSSIEAVIIPSIVESIGDNAFEICSGLTNIVFMGNAPEMGESVFSYCPTNCTAYVSRSSTGWGVEIPGMWKGINIAYLDDEPAADVAVAVTAVRQRWPWNGLVDIHCTVSGMDAMTNGLMFAVAALNPETGGSRNVSHVQVMRDGAASSDLSVSGNGDYWLVWDASADLGTVLYSNMQVSVTLKGAGSVGVQLWEGGPYWAETNIGAEEPWDSGLYFWWGDTVGYRREGDAWVASDGSSQDYSFDVFNTPTSYFNTDDETLESEGWIVSQGNDYVLAPEHDAAQMHWGGNWRMPTFQESSDLCENCDWTWTTTNGVNGYVISGRGDYASASIFLPAAGRGQGTSFEHAGSQGNYWSSSFSDYGSCCFGFVCLPDAYDSECHGADVTYFEQRDLGLPVRPVQGVDETAAPSTTAVCADVSAPFRLDTAEGARAATAGEALPVTYSPRWGGAASCSVADNGSALLSGATEEGVLSWTPSSGGRHVLTHTAGTNALEAVFLVESMPFDFDTDAVEMAILGGEWDVNSLSLTVEVRMNPASEGGVERFVSDVERGALRWSVPGKEDLWNDWCYVAGDMLYGEGVEIATSNAVVFRVSLQSDDLQFRFLKIYLEDERSSSQIESSNIVKLTAMANQEGEIVRTVTVGTTPSDFAVPTRVVDFNDFLINHYLGNGEPLVVSCGDRVRFSYDLRELCDYGLGGSDYVTPFIIGEHATHAYGIDNDWSDDWEEYGRQFSDRVPNAGFFDLLVWESPGRYALILLPDWDEWWIDDDFSGWWNSLDQMIEEVQREDGVFTIIEVDVVEQSATPIVTFDLGEHGVRTGGGELVQTVTNGCYAVAPEVAADDGWEFIGWEPDVGAEIISNTTFVAEYGKWYYYENEDETITIEGLSVWSDRQGHLDVPGTIDGKQVTGIEEQAFWGWRGLISVTIPDGVTSIGDMVFADCSDLTSVSIPDSVTSIGYDAFKGCNSELYDTETIPGVVLVDGWAVGCSYVRYPFEEELCLTGCRGIGSLAFWGCEFQTPLTIPGSVKGIGESAFELAIFWSTLTIEHGVVRIGTAAFGISDSPMSLVIPGSVREIGRCAFSNSHVSSIEIEDGVPDIGPGAFLYATALASVTIANSVTNIGSAAFGNCRSLEHITIPDGVRNIEGGVEGGAFECSGLASVTIGSGVTNIGEHAFYFCRNLTNLLFRGNAPVMGDDVFGDCPTNCTAYVSRFSTGWGVEIPGTWQGINIAYFDDDPETPELPDGVRVVDGVTNFWLEVEQPARGGSIGCESGWHPIDDMFMIQASANPGYRFVEWTGDVAGLYQPSAGRLAVVMDQPRTIGASFAPIEYAISYTGTHGAANPNPATYTVEDEFAFSPLPNVEGWNFQGWTPSGVSAGTTGDFTATALWSRPEIIVGVDGWQTTYNYGDTPTFTAPEPRETNGMQVVTLGTTFTAPAVTNEFSLTLTHDIAFFWDILATNWWLDAEAPANGAIHAFDDAGAVATPCWMPDGAGATFEAVPDAGFRFVRWTGDTDGCVETNGLLLATMDRARTIGAEFALNLVPVIDAISPASPTEDDALVMQGHAEGAAAVEYLWRAIRASGGAASTLGRAQVCRATLPAGAWRIEFLAKDASGAWSEAASALVDVGESLAMPDLQVARANVTFTDALGLPTANVMTGDVVTVRAVVQNRGAAALPGGAAVYLCDGLVPVEDLATFAADDARIVAAGSVADLAAGRSQTATLTWTVGLGADGGARFYEDGPNAFTLVALPLAGLDRDANAANNLASMMLEFGDGGESLSDLLRVSANCESSLWEGEQYAVSGSVWYERNGVRAMMAGAAVTLSIDGDVADEVVTDASGRYVCAFTAPAAGEHAYEVRATDGAAVKTASGAFTSRARPTEGEGGGSGGSGGTGGGEEVGALRGPNLVVTALAFTGSAVRSWSSSSFGTMAGASAGLSMTIANTGDVAVTNAFAATLSLSRQDDRLSGLSVVEFLFTEPLAPGASATRTLSPDALSEAAAGTWLAHAEADIRDAVAEYSETDNARSAWLNVETPRPNLVITDISLSDSRPVAGGTVTATAMVRNDGDLAVSNAFAVSFSRNGDALGSATVSGGLAPGASTPVAFEVSLPAAGEVRLAATADAGRVVEESAEGDNGFSRTITVYAAEAAVRPVALAADPYPAAGRTSVLTATFRNDGGAAYAGGTATFREGGRVIGTGTVGQIAWKGGVGYATCAWTPSDNSDHVVTVTLEGVSFEKTFAQTAPPDLRVTAEDISFEPGTPAAGDAMRFRAMVRNVGSAAATNVAVLFTVAGRDGIAQPLSTMTVATLAAGGSVAVDADAAFTPARGTYTIGVAVRDGAGREANASDNSASRTFGVSVPVAVAEATSTGIAGDVIVLDGTASTDATGFRWTLAEAPAGNAAAVSNAFAATASFVPALAGTYRFTLVVDDGETESAPSECVVAIDRVRVTAEAAEGGAIEPAGDTVWPAGADVSFTAVPDRHHHLVAWTGDTEGCAETNGTILVAMDRVRVIGATFALDGVSIGEAVGAPAQDWTAGGAADWAGEWSDDAPDGEAWARSGAIGNNAESWVGTTFEGEGTLSFSWRVACEGRSDYAAVEIDGAIRDRLSGVTDWADAAYVLGAGSHVVRWLYRTGRSGSTGAGVAWLDAVRWSSLSPMTLAEALDATNLVWATDGDAPWGVARGTDAADGDGCGVSGAIGDDGSSVLRTTVAGPGTLSFQWRVSCEEGYDWFDFLVDGKVVKCLTGESGWASFSFDVPDGRHELVWEYWKDELDDEGMAGEDRAMLDQVSYVTAPGAQTPDETDEIIVEDVAIPVTWIESAASRFVTGSGGDLAAAARAPAANGRPVWECYVADLDPNDPDAELLVTIEIVDGKPEVRILSGESPRRVYTKQGAKTLGGDWDDLEEGEDWDAAGYRFFRVKVDLP